MQVNKSGWMTAIVAAGVLAAGPLAHAASNPLAADIAVSCTSNTCNALSSSFGGRIDWYSGNVLLYSEIGTFTHDAVGVIRATITGTNSSVAFSSTYLDPMTSIFAAPDLTFKLFSTDAGDVLLVTQPYHPQADALWAKHSEDAQSEATRALAAEDTINTALNIEVSKRSLGDKNFQSQLDAEVLARKQQDATLQINIDHENQRAVAAENVLTTNLNSEVSRAKAAEAAELARATNAEQTELARALAAELAELNRATNAEAVLTMNLANEIDRATSTEILNSANDRAYTDAQVLTEHDDRVADVQNAIVVTEAYTDARYSNKPCPPGQRMTGIDGNGNPTCAGQQLAGRVKTFAQNGVGTCSYQAACSTGYPSCSCSCSGGWWASGSCSCSCTSTATVSCSNSQCTAAATATTCPDVGGTQGLSQFASCPLGAWDGANGCLGVAQTATGSPVSCNNSGTASCSCSCGLGWWGGSCSCGCQPGDVLSCNGGNGTATATTATAICVQVE